MTGCGYLYLLGECAIGSVDGHVTEGEPLLSFATGLGARLLNVSLTACGIVSWAAEL